MNIFLRCLGVLVFILVGSACKRGSEFLYKERPPKVPRAAETIGRLEGKISDPSGVGIDGVSLSVKSVASGTLKTATADRYGRFQMGELKAGQYYVDFSHPAYHSLKNVRTDIVGGRATLLNLVLSKQPGNLTGRVTDSATGAPLDNVLVEVDVSGSMVTARTDANGNYTITGLAEAPYRVNFSREKYVVVQNVATQIRAAQTTRLDMALVGAVGKLVGRVTDGLDGAGIKDVEVVVRDTNNATLHTVRTNADGYYEAGPIDEGEVRVDFKADGYTPLLNEAAQIYAGQTTTLDAVLNSSLGVLRGHVTNAVNANPLEGVKVTVHKGRANGPVVVQLMTDVSGDYRTQPLEPGNYFVDFELDGFVPLMAMPAELRAGEITVLDVSLTEKLRVGQFRIVMSWTESIQNGVKDVDSYLKVPGVQRPVYYGNLAPDQNAKLDVDDTDWSGPETVTIYTQLSGTYTYYVDNYSDRCEKTWLGKSKVLIQVYGESGLLKTYRVPAGRGVRYKVFELTNGRIRDVERYDDTLWADGSDCGN